MLARLVAASTLSLLTVFATPALAHHRWDHPDPPGHHDRNGNDADRDDEDDDRDDERDHGRHRGRHRGETAQAPEPSVILMVGAGLLGGIVLRRKLNRT